MYWFHYIKIMDLVIGKIILVRNIQLNFSSLFVGNANVLMLDIVKGYQNLK